MRFWITTVLILCTAYFVLQYTMHPPLRYNTVMNRIQQPFDHRVRYRIGEIDPRFQISHEQVKQLTQQAADIWQQGSMQSLFVYDAAAQLSIHLIYDERQAESLARSQEIKIIENSRQYTDAQHQDIKRLEQQLEQTKNTFDAYEQHYQSKLEHYNQTVASFNQTHQPLTESTYAQFNQQKQQLQQQQIQLQQYRNAFNAQVQQLNQKITHIQQVNQQLNQSIDQFNHRFKPRQFDKGLFNGKQINIYEFESDADLRLTLAHELGHALNLPHNHDPKALMYPIMKQQDLNNFKLTHADLALLNSRSS